MTATAYFTSGRGDAVSIPAGDDGRATIARLTALADQPRIATIMWHGGGQHSGAQLIVGIDRVRETGFVEYHGYDSFISDNDSHDTTVVWYSDGWDHGHDVSATAQIPAAAVATALNEFLTDGALPSTITWSSQAP